MAVCVCLAFTASAEAASFQVGDAGPEVAEVQQALLDWAMMWRPTAISGRGRPLRYENLNDLEGLQLTESSGPRSIRRSWDVISRSSAAGRGRIPIAA